jgi:serine/threonine protein kinase
MYLLFTESAKRPPEERAAYLNEACPEDADLRGEVVELLASAERAAREKFLELPWMADDVEEEHGDAWVLKPLLCRLAGTTIRAENMGSQQPGKPGEPETPPSIALDQTPHQNETPTSPVDKPFLPGYEIQQELGRGGMGIVYKARQTSLNRIVAVKIILSGDEMDGERRMRFRTEGEAIARLQHPHIVQIHELGEQDGRPFVVLEYVEGGSLDQQLNGMPQPVEVSVRLIETLARAIHYAHERGIVHRDLKPANVLLQIADGRLQIERKAEDQSAIYHPQSAIPKITDFGLAKLLRDEGKSQGERTPTGMILGTPQYMAPEQARGPREAVGPAADVYALGAILYEMLTGRPAFQGETPLETLEQARLQEPVAPRRLRPKLPRDLETICLKCLDKAAQRRYSSAEELAEDLRRFLADEPIRARPLAAWRRGLKWARRHPATAASLAVTSAAIVSILGGGLWYNARLQVALAKAEYEQERAEANYQKAADATERMTLANAQERKARERSHKVLKYFVETFRKADPSQEGDEVKVVDVLRRNAEELPTRSDLDPATRGVLLNAIGATYLGLGFWHKAVDVLEQARTLCEQHVGPDDPETLATMHSLAVAYMAAGRLTDALPLFEETVKLQKAKLPSDDPNTLVSINALARAYREAGRLVDALRLCEENLNRTKAELGPTHPSTLTAMNNLALAHRDAGRIADALPLFEETLELLTKELGPQNPRRLGLMNNLALAYCDAGRSVDAVPLFEQTLKLRETNLGPEHPETLLSMYNLALAYHDVGRFADALPLGEESFRLLKALLGPEHPDTINSMNNLAGVYQALGRLADAVPLFEETVKLRKAKQGLNHPGTLAAMNNLGLAYRDAGRFADAVRVLDETLKLCKEKLGSEHPKTLLTLNNLALAFKEGGRSEQALPLFEETLKQKKAKLGLEHPSTLRAMNNLAATYHAVGRSLDALPLFQETLELRRAKLGPHHPDTLLTLSSLAELLMDLGKLTDAEPLLRQVLTERNVLPANHPALTYSLFGLGSVLTETGRAEEGEPLLREYVQILSNQPTGPARTAVADMALGQCLITLGRYAEAEPFLLSGYETLKRAKARPEPLGKVIERITQLYEAWEKPDNAAAWRVERDSITNLTSQSN